MDLRMRWLLIGGAAAAALLAVAALPPRACSPDDHSFVAGAMCAGQWGWPTGGRHEGVTRRTLNALELQLERRLLADSLRARAAGPQAVRSPLGLTVVYETPFTADSARAWLAQAEREVSLLPSGGTGVPVILYLVTDPRGQLLRKLGHESDPPGVRSPWDRFAVRSSDGRTTCIVRGDLFTRRQAGTTTTAIRRNILDWCALYARYGVPGDGVAAWAGANLSTRWWAPGAPIAEEAAVGGGSAPSQWTGEYFWRACRNGAEEVCTRLPGLTLRSDVFGNHNELARHFLAWLLANGGGDAFGRFWRGQGTVADALQHAYGRSSGATARMWVLSASRPAGRGERPRVLLASAVWTSLALAAAFVAMQRRQVG